MEDIDVMRIDIKCKRYYRWSVCKFTIPIIIEVMQSMLSYVADYYYIGYFMMYKSSKFIDKSKKINIMWSLFIILV